MKSLFLSDSFLIGNKSLVLGFKPSSVLSNVFCSLPNSSFKYLLRVSLIISTFKSLFLSDSSLIGNKSLVLGFKPSSVLSNVFCSLPNSSFKYLLRVSLIISTLKSLFLSDSYLIGNKSLVLGFKPSSVLSNVFCSLPNSSFKYLLRVSLIISTLKSLFLSDSSLIGNKSLV